MRWFMLKYYQLFLQDITALLYIKRRREQKLDIRFLTFSEIEVFGKQLLDKLKKIDYVPSLALSRNDTQLFFECYSDCFCNDKKNGISLCENIGTQELVERFVGWMNIDVLNCVDSI